MMALVMITVVVSKVSQTISTRLALLQASKLFDPSLHPALTLSVPSLSSPPRPRPTAELSDANSANPSACNDRPIAKASAIKFIATFRSLFGRNELHSLLPLLSPLLAADSFVVHTYAAAAIERVLTVKDKDAATGKSQPRVSVDALAPVLPSILQSLFTRLVISICGSYGDLPSVAASLSRLHNIRVSAPPPSPSSSSLPSFLLPAPPPQHRRRHVPRERVLDAVHHARGRYFQGQAGATGGQHDWGADDGERACSGLFDWCCFDRAMSACIVSDVTVVRFLPSHAHL